MYVSVHIERKVLAMGQMCRNSSNSIQVLLLVDKSSHKEVTNMLLRVEAQM